MSKDLKAWTLGEHLVLLTFRFKIIPEINFSTRSEKYDERFYNYNKVMEINCQGH